MVGVFVEVVVKIFSRDAVEATPFTFDTEITCHVLVFMVAVCLIQWLFRGQGSTNRNYEYGNIT